MNIFLLIILILVATFFISFFSFIAGMKTKENELYEEASIEGYVTLKDRIYKVNKFIHIVETKEL